MSLVPEDLRSAWFGDVGLTVESGERLAGLIARYGEAHRHYHATSHVVSVLNHLPAVLEAEGIAADSPVARSLRLALWYHDAIYDVHSPTNESDSAVLAERELRSLGLEDALCADVSRLVIATKHPSSPQSIDEAIIIDVDLGILAASAENYDRYVDQVRAEYAFVSDEDWRIGRSKVLQSFLDSDALFHTSTAKQWTRRPGGTSAVNLRLWLCR
jgi:predicted metal-dependent HD superfamily phosphohydrolase